MRLEAGGRLGRAAQYVLPSCRPLLDVSRSTISQRYLINGSPLSLEQCRQWLVLYVAIFVKTRQVV